MATLNIETQFSRDTAPDSNVAETHQVTRLGGRNKGVAPCRDMLPRAPNSTDKKNRCAGMF